MNFQQEPSLTERNQQLETALMEKTRALEIEAALDRVRTVAMNMQQPDDLLHICEILYSELRQLGFSALRNTMINIHDDVKGSFLNYDFSGFAGKTLTTIFYDSHPVVASHVRQIKRGDDAFAEMEVKGKELANWRKFRKENGEQDDPRLSAIKALYYYFYSVAKGDLGISNFEPLPEDQLAILKRFSNVFDLAYKRYTDITNAEAQAREAQVEAALERVRSRTMAMRYSNELAGTASTLFQQIKDLGFNMWSCGFCIWKEDSFTEVWMNNDAGGLLPPMMIPYKEEPTHREIYEASLRGDTVHEKIWEGEALQKHYAFLQTIPSVKEALGQLKSAGLSLPSRQCYYAGFFRQGYLLLINKEPKTETGDLAKRFAQVFEQTYTRFLDLQKAEAQTRESQIELSLERVRAKTMAMHNSTDVGETAAVMVDELQKLGIETIRCGIGIMHEPGDMEVWTISTDESYKTTIIIGWLDMNMHPLLHGAFQSWRNKVESYSYELKEADLLNYYNAINNYPGYPIRYDTANLPKQIHHNEFHFTEGTLFAFSLQQLTETQRKIFKRFAGVFGQTYRRYLDLKKAEAQARQAKIEAAMEKVRARAMAMQKPDELVEVAELLRREMGLLGVEELETSSIYIHHEETGKTACWYAIKDVQHPEKELVSDHMTIELDKTWVGKQMLAFYLSGQQQVSIPMQGDKRKEWINYCAAHSAVLEGFYGDSIPDRTYHLYKFSNGYMGAASPGDISAESWDLLRRATLVFSLAYTRFSDLQQAEAQAREAKIETALERVRSRTLAMQKSDELAETAAEVFRQLISLGIEPNRLYIGIVNEESGDMEMWATDEDGTHVGKKFMFNKNENVSVKRLFDGWKAKEKSVKVDMQGKELEDYFHYLNNVMHIPFKGGLTQKRRVQSVAYFSKGFIGMASPDGQGEETIQLLERFAAVFNLSFTRFNDLKIAEAHAQQAEQDLIAIKEAKQKAEEALTELQATQKQLIQSEKMASLGELTAGIAHEIQNPLNFVNNFSEVSNELMDEMNAEIEKGDMAEARAIANEIKQNLEKINHHGKRAEAIVKGMLQHSRSSSASKESTDINKLADEYLRLAYHGLRAKDKAFNAILKTDYDETTGNINIVPQDIGRVLLNLITNAFYATNERRKLVAVGYEPLVAISTKKMGDKIEISVRDNGGGIPQNIVDKIFQPFFTTKPTGQGTGLGLSLAYDIVEAHGGKLIVVTSESEGTTFIIQLPGK